MFAETQKCYHVQMSTQHSDPQQQEVSPEINRADETEPVQSVQRSVSVPLVAAAVLVFLIVVSAVSISVQQRRQQQQALLEELSQDVSEGPFDVLPAPDADFLGQDIARNDIPQDQVLPPADDTQRRQANEEKIEVIVDGAATTDTQYVVPSSSLGNFEKISRESLSQQLLKKLIVPAHAQVGGSETAVMLFLNPEIATATQLLALDTNSLEVYKIADFEETVVDYGVFGDGIYVYSYQTIPLTNDYEYRERDIEKKLFRVDLSTGGVELVTTGTIRSLSPSLDGEKLLGVYYVQADFPRTSIKLLDAQSGAILKEGFTDLFLSDIQWLDSETLSVTGGYDQYFSQITLDELFADGFGADIGPSVMAAGKERVRVLHLHEGVYYHVQSEESTAQPVLAIFDSNTDETFFVDGFSNVRSSILNPNGPVLYVLGDYAINDSAPSQYGLHSIGVDLSSQSSNVDLVEADFVDEYYGASLVGWDGSYDALLLSTSESGDEYTTELGESIRTKTTTLWTVPTQAPEVQYKDSFNSRSSSVSGVFD